MYAKNKKYFKTVLLFSFIVVMVLSQFTVPFLHTNQPMAYSVQVRHSKFDLRFNTWQFGVVSNQTNNKTIKLVSVATIYSNISKTINFLATQNNSLLYYKTNIFIETHKNVTINSKNYTQNSFIVFSNITFNSITVKYSNVIFIIRLKQISSFRDVPDVENEINGIFLTWNDVYRLVIVGIVAFVMAFVVMLLIVSYKKRAEIVEGLESEL